MISLVIAVMMVAQMLSALAGGLLEITFGWRAIFYFITAASLSVAVLIAIALPETRRERSESSGGFRGDVRSLLKSRAFIGYVLCQVLASQIIFTFAGGGPYIVVTQMGRTTAEYGAWFATTGFAYLVGNLFCVRFAPRHSLENLIWFGLALQLGGSLLNLIWSFAGINQAPGWLFGTQMIVMVANAFVMANASAGAISVRPEAAGTASGAMGFLQQGVGALVSQFGAYLGGHSTTTLPLTAAIFALSIACACGDVLPGAAAGRGGERGTDREGGGGRTGDVVAQLPRHPASPAVSPCPARMCRSLHALRQLDQKLLVARQMVNAGRIAAGEPRHRLDALPIGDRDELALVRAILSQALHAHRLLDQGRDPDLIQIGLVFVGAHAVWCGRARCGQWWGDQSSFLLTCGSVGLTTPKWRIRSCSKQHCCHWSQAGLKPLAFTPRSASATRPRSAQSRRASWRPPASSRRRGRR